ncbi:hypothetical protein WAB17_00425 [Parerythrobacter aurantius]|uniref:hypothetical protein n=1 Tax=Parerythrobacter aurantius TaxID=3127706 RepID=UPI00324ED823
MNLTLALVIDYLLKAGAVFLAVNEIRGLILAGPVIYGIYQSGGNTVAILVGLSTLGGIALSVIIPLIAARQVRRYALARADGR